MQIFSFSFPGVIGSSVRRVDDYFILLKYVCFLHSKTKIFNFLRMGHLFIFLVFEWQFCFAFFFYGADVVRSAFR